MRLLGGNGTLGAHWLQACLGSDSALFGYGEKERSAASSDLGAQNCLPCTPCGYNSTFPDGCNEGITAVKGDLADRDLDWITLTIGRVPDQLKRTPHRQGPEVLTCLVRRGAQGQRADKARIEIAPTSNQKRQHQADT